MKDTLFGESLELRVRLFNIWAMVGVFVGLVSAAYCMLDGEGPVTASYCAAVSAYLLGLILYATKTGRYLICYAATIVVVFVISYAAIFFLGGGNVSSMPFYFIIAIAFTMYMLEGRWSVALAAAELIFYSALCVYAYVRPESVRDLPGDLTRLIDTIAGFAVVSAMLSVTITFQIRVFERQRQDLEKARDEAQRYSEAKGRFLANMSHEIRTPINVIMGMNEMTLRESSQASVRGYAKNIEKAGKTLMTLISNVLDVSRVESGKIEIVKESYSTYELADELFMTGEELAGQRRLEFRSSIDESAPRTLVGDRARVKQVALNFLGNAVKYTKKGYVGLEIYYKDGSLYIAVSDTGIGIKPEAVSGLFEAFSRSDASRGSSVDGVGLGLAIAKELTELMGGRIDVKSEPGAGSVFIASFPQSVPAVSSGAVLGSRPAAWRAPALYRGRDTSSGSRARAKTLMIAPNARTLIVDDNEENRDVLLALLERTRTRVEAVASGAECVAAARAARYDVIFLDYMMPEMDGVETLTALKAIPGFNTPVIALTANVVAGVERRLLEAGFSKYLSKPVMWADLEDALLSSLPPSLLESGTAAAKDCGRLDADREKLAASGVLIGEALAFFGGDVRQYLRVAGIFCDGAQTAVEEAGKRIDARDWANLRHRVHSLKSSAKSVGAVNLSATAARIEALCETGDGEYIAAIAPLLKYEWIAARDALGELCARNPELAADSGSRSGSGGDGDGDSDGDAGIDAGMDVGSSLREAGRELADLLKIGRQSDAVELIERLVKMCETGKPGEYAAKASALREARILALDAEYREAASVLKQNGIIIS